MIAREFVFARRANVFFFARILYFARVVFLARRANFFSARTVSCEQTCFCCFRADFFRVKNAFQEKLESLMAVLGDGRHRLQRRSLNRLLRASCCHAFCRHCSTPLCARQGSEMPTIACKGAASTGF